MLTPRETWNEEHEQIWSELTIKDHSKILSFMESQGFTHVPNGNPLDEKSYWTNYIEEESEFPNGKGTLNEGNISYSLSSEMPGMWISQINQYNWKTHKGDLVFDAKRTIIQGLTIKERIIDGNIIIRGPASGLTFRDIALTRGKKIVIEGGDRGWSNGHIFDNIRMWDGAVEIHKGCSGLKFTNLQIQPSKKYDQEAGVKCHGKNCYFDAQLWDWQHANCPTYWFGSASRRNKVEQPTSHVRDLGKYNVWTSEWK